MHQRPTKIPTIFDEFLREIPTDADLLARALGACEHDIRLLRQMVHDDPSELNTTRLGRVLQRYGEYLRLAGRGPEALQAKDEAIEIWAKYGRQRAHFLARMQRATIQAEGGTPELAITALQELGTELDPKTMLYADFLQESLGRAYLASHLPEKAIEHLESALELRQKKGNQRHIDHTLELLQIARKHGPAR